MSQKILFVDDNADILQILKLMFENEYEIFTACSATEAIEIQSRESIQVVVTDLGMPEMNGLELCQKVKSEMPFCIFVAVTGCGAEFDIKECRRSGFDDYLLKPFDEAVIQEIIAESFKRINRWIINVNPCMNDKQDIESADEKALWIKCQERSEKGENFESFKSIWLNNCNNPKFIENIRKTYSTKSTMGNIILNALYLTEDE